MKKILAGALIVVAGLFMLSVSSVMAQGEPCTADFNCDQAVAADDVAEFLNQFGRGEYNDPCPDCYDSPCPCNTGPTCEGGLSPLGRWCDQFNGTVKDMTNGLVWLKKADWSGYYALWADISSPDAHHRAAELWDGSPYEGTAGLSDGSSEGDWRLPTKNELVGITNGSEYIRSSSTYFFTGVLSDYYWTCTSREGFAQDAWYVYMDDGNGYVGNRLAILNVWPVRSDN